MFTSNFSAGLAELATAFVPVLLGIVLHEVAHGWVASLRGDQTARMLGRLTLNPVPHIDPMGLVMFAVTALFTPWSYSRLGRYGFLLLLVLLMTGVVGAVLLPLIQISVNVALTLVQWLLSL